MKDLDRAVSAGATTYLVKTRYEIREVLDKIKKTLRK